jgi:hypothetical protein
MAAAAQVQELISVDRADPAWYVQRNFQPYSEEDSKSIERAIRYVLASPRPAEYYLVPLTPLGNGTQYSVAIIWREPLLTMFQFRIVITGAEMPTRYRAVDVPDSIKAEYPGAIFVSTKTDNYDDAHLFWMVHRESCVSAFRVFGVARPLLCNGITTTLMLTYVKDVGVWGETPLLSQRYFSPVLGGLIQTSLCELCTPEVEMSSVMVSDPSNGDRFVAILTNKNSNGEVEEVNVVDITVMKSTPDNTASRERQVVFPLNMGQIFPNIRFKSERLTDAEKNILFQEPVRRHYEGKVDDYFVLCRLALAMSMHKRLSKPDDTPGVALPRFHLRNLDSELVAKIAALAL